MTTSSRFQGVIAPVKRRIQLKISEHEARIQATPLRERCIEISSEPHGTGTAAYMVASGTLSEDSVVYSCGVGDDISFDLSLIGRYRLTVHAFDPTPESARFIERAAPPPEFQYHQYAVGSSDAWEQLQSLKPVRTEYRAATLLGIDKGGSQMQVPVMRLSTIMEKLGHQRIDLLKLDVEGAEYAVLEDLMHDIRFDQLVVEFHPHLLNLRRDGRLYGDHGWDRTKGIINRLDQQGFELFHVSSRGTEMSFRRR